VLVIDGFVSFSYGEDVDEDADRKEKVTSA
jgi:hypothetical protein